MQNTLSRDELARRVNLHPRRISELARQGKIPGLEPIQRGRYIRHFPAKVTPALSQWIAATQKIAYLRADELKARQKRSTRPNQNPNVAAIHRLTSQIGLLMDSFIGNEVEGGTCPETLLAMHKVFHSALVAYGEVLHQLRKQAGRKYDVEIYKDGQDIAETLRARAAWEQLLQIHKQAKSSNTSQLRQTAQAGGSGGK